MQMNNTGWYTVENVSEIDSPALLVYPDQIAANIDLAIRMAGRVEVLRPHVKTNKIEEVSRMLLQAGILKFKCATIAEAEMLARIEAPDVLLAYQPTGPKVLRLLQLIESYPATRFSCLLDNSDSAEEIAMQCDRAGTVLSVFIDLNVGMNRTGVMPAEAVQLATLIRSFDSLLLVGLHGYDGHIHDEKTVERLQAANQSHALVDEVRREIQPEYSYPLTMVMGGTPTFPIHAQRNGIECSPGTFVFWDLGYARILADMPFQWAALAMTRIISIIDPQHICLDLGYKAVASESPLPRIYFLNAPEAMPVSQSEEHLVVKVTDSGAYHVGSVFYGVPVHICPTVALYDRAYVIRSHRMETYWNVIARDRFITI